MTILVTEDFLTLLFENRFYMFILLHKINTLCFGGATKVELQQVGIFLTLNFLPWEFFNKKVVN